MKYASKEAFEAANHFGTGEENVDYAQYFTGASFLNGLGATDDGKLAFHNVTFEPGCRNSWHIHHASQGGGVQLAKAGTKKKASQRLA